MTQNKQFKKRVRARMAETGETYVQARRALDDGRNKPFTLRQLGYWKSLQEPHLPDPIDFVDASWDLQERQRVVEYLSRGAVLKQSLESSWCRLGCGQKPQNPKHFFSAAGTTDEDKTWQERREARRVAALKTENAGELFEHVEMGSSDLTDGVYVWPEGLVHYVEKHNVRLPTEFVKHVLNSLGVFGPLPLVYGLNETWWCREWTVITKKDLIERTAWSQGPAPIIQIESPFPAGWYFHDEEYPEEGSEGPYKTLHDAQHAALQSGNDGHGNFDEVFREWLHEEITIEEAFEKLEIGGVTFWEQKDNATVMQRYLADYLKVQMRNMLDAVTDQENNQGFREGIRDRLTTLVSVLRSKAQKAGVKVPPEDGIEVGFPEPSEKDVKNNVLRVSVTIHRPEWYPEFVRDLVDEGLLDPHHRVSMQLKEEA